MNISTGFTTNNEKMNRLIVLFGPIFNYIFRAVLRVIIYLGNSFDVWVYTYEGKTSASPEDRHLAGEYNLTTRDYNRPATIHAIKHMLPKQGPACSTHSLICAASGQC